MAFIIKAYVVSISGHDDVTIFGKNKNQVRMKAFNSYGVCRDISFKDFLKLKPVISQTDDVPSCFGRSIKVDSYDGGFVDAYMVCHRGNTVSCVFPNDDRIRNYHELDCQLLKEGS